MVEDTISLSSKARAQVKADYERALKDVTDENMKRAMVFFVSNESGKSGNPPVALELHHLPSSEKKNCIVM